MATAPRDNPADPTPPSDAGGSPKPPPRSAGVVKRAEGIHDIVRQIRQELAGMSAHELDLQRREQEFRQEYKRLEEAAQHAARVEIEDLQKRLASRTAALNAQAAEVAAGRQRLQALTHQLHTQEGRLHQQQLEIELQAERMRRRASQLGDRFRADRQSIRQRIAVIRSRERELERRVQLARDDITRQRTELQSNQVELQERAAALAQSEQSLRARWEELEQQICEEATRVADAARQAEEVAAERTRLEEERRALEHAARDLAAAQAALTERQKELDRRWQAAHEQRHALNRQLEELDARRRVLQQHEGTHDERLHRLEERERQFADKLAGLEADHLRLDGLQAEIAQREASAAEAGRRVQELERQARQAQQEAGTLREQAAARENETRQAALSLELERQEFERQRDTLTTGQQQLDAARSRHDQETAATRALLDERTARVAAAEQMVRQAALPKDWRRRTIALSATAALVTGVAWFMTHPPVYRATCAVRIECEAQAGRPAGANVQAEIVAAHRAALLDPKLLDDAAVEPQAAAAWEDAWARGTIAVAPADEPLTLRLQVDDRKAERARRLAELAAQSYARRVNGVPPDANLPKHYADFAQWRAQLQATLEQTHRQRATDQAELNALAAAAARDARAAEATALQSELDQTAKELADARSALNVLVATDVPPVRVEAADVEDALAGDAMYREDGREYLSVAVQYRTELAVNMVLLADPLQGIQKVLDDLAASLTEQRGMSPPAELVGTLDAGLRDVEHARLRLNDFASRWRAAVETVQQTGLDDAIVEPAVVELVQHQDAAANAARHAADDVVKLVDDNGARVEALQTSGDGSTRAVVVAAVLRGDHAALKTAAEAFLATAAKTALADNIELASLDRKLRGLRMRLDQRRELVRQRLQLDAERTARETHAARVAELRERALELEQRREELVTQVLASLDQLRRLDGQARREAELLGRKLQQEADITRLTAQIEELDAKLAEARRHGPRPDRVALGPTTVALLSQARFGPAALAAAAAAAGALALCTLTVNRSPWSPTARGPGGGAARPS